MATEIKRLTVNADHHTEEYRLEYWIWRLVGAWLRYGKQLRDFTVDRMTRLLFPLVYLHSRIN